MNSPCSPSLVNRNIPSSATKEEKALCRKAIAEYKEIRPVVQFGDLYRLVSPYDNQGLSSKKQQMNFRKLRLWPMVHRRKRL